MGVRIIADPEAETDGAAIYDSVTGTAFGPVFADREEAEQFLDWLAAHGGDRRDARQYTTSGLAALRAHWLDRHREVIA